MDPVVADEVKITATEEEVTVAIEPKLFVTVSVYVAVVVGEN